MPATSEPAPGSVIPSAAMRSPRMAGARKRCFWSSVPNFQIGGVAMPMCAPMPAASPPEPQRAELLAEHGVLEVAAAAAAVLDRVLQPEQPELGHPVEDLVREPARRLPLGRMRAQLLGDEAPDLRPQLLVLLAERRQRPHTDRLWPRPAWSKPSRSPLGFLRPPWW